MHESPRATPTVAINVRLPTDLHARLVQLAASEYRSLNRELLALIQEALNERERRQDDKGNETR